MRWIERARLRLLEAELPGARALFTTRLGGVSEGPYAALNIGLLTGDAWAAVGENRRRVAAAAALDPEAMLMGHQVHGAHVEVRNEAPRPNPYPDPDGARPHDADGQATARPELAPLVLVADCLPVALAGPRGVAMLHCGWRGLAAGIIERGVEALGEAHHAAIGPGIGPCCYEVGPDVLARFESLGGGVATGRMLDLRTIARMLLERAGVDAVEVSELCTSCNPELFFSHRRDGERTGRQAGLVRLLDDVGGP